MAQDIVVGGAIAYVPPKSGVHLVRPGGIDIKTDDNCSVKVSLKVSDVGRYTAVGFVAQNHDLTVVHNVGTRLTIRRFVKAAEKGQKLCRVTSGTYLGWQDTASAASGDIAADCESMMDRALWQFDGPMEASGAQDKLKWVPNDNKFIVNDQPSLLFTEPGGFPYCKLMHFAFRIEWEDKSIECVYKCRMLFPVDPYRQGFRTQPKHVFDTKNINTDSFDILNQTYDQLIISPPSFPSVPTASIASKKHVRKSSV